MDKFEHLRARAESLLRQRQAHASDPELDQVQDLLHELGVHQIELELQNEELRSARTALEAARDRYADLYDFAPVGYFTLDAHGIIREANLTGAQLLGAARGQLMGQRFSAFVSPPHQDDYYLFFTRISDSRPGPQVCTLEMVTQEGSPFMARLETRTVQEPVNGETQYRVALSDVSQQERMRAQLAAERARLAAIIQHAPEGIIVTDAQDHVVLANPAAEALFGGPLVRDAASLSADSLRLHYPNGAPYASQDLPLIRAAREGGVMRDEEVLLLRPGAERRTLLVSAAPVWNEHAHPDSEGAVAVFQDITARKQVEDQLRRYAQRLQVLREVDQAILAARSGQEIARLALRYVRRLTSCQRCSVALFDFDAREMDLLAVESGSGAGSGPLLNQNGPMPLEQAWYVDALQQGGDYVTEDLSALPAGSPLLEALQQEGVRAWAVLPLVAGEALIGALDLGMDRSGRLDPEQVELVREITRRVLDFARPGQETLEVVSLEVLVERTLALMNKNLEHSGVDVQLDLADGLPPVRVNADQVVQVLVNILVNALDAMPDGGRVDITTWGTGRTVTLALANTGRPIPEQDLDRVFEPFFSTKADGSGLGLSISYSIIERYGGTLYVENLPDGGGYVS